MNVRFIISEEILPMLSPLSAWLSFFSRQSVGSTISSDEDFVDLMDRISDEFVLEWSADLMDRISDEFVLEWMCDF